MSGRPAPGGPTLRALPLTSAGLGDAFDVRPSPAANEGFREDRRYLFERPGAGWSLFVDDEALEHAPEQPAAWLWEPGFYAGEVTAELRHPSGRVATLYLLDVSPDPLKTGRETFEEMLAEIWAEDPLLVTGSEPATRKIGTLGEAQNPLLELARLRRHGPNFLQALIAACARPRRELVTRRELTPLHRVRRVDRRTAAAAARSPDVVAFLAGTLPPAAQVAALQLDVPRVEESLDCPANRCLVALANGVLRRARALAGRLQDLVNREPTSATRTPLATRWPTRRRFLEDLTDSLSAILNRPPLSKVHRSEVTASGLNAVSSDPLYARAWRAGWHSLRPGVAGPLTNEPLWISPTWEIYERWCFVRLGRLLRHACPELTWERASSHPTNATAAWRGVGSERSVELLLQPVFPGGHRLQKHGFWSVSRQRIPDFMVVVTEAGESRFLLLDAKYRRSRGSVLDAMTSAHVYQDSLRLSDRRPEGTILLVPAGGEAPWLEDPSFQQEHRVGVHQLTPDDSPQLPTLLRALFPHSTV